LTRILAGINFPYRRTKDVIQALFCFRCRPFFKNDLLGCGCCE
jgi:hypothetical protein